MKRILSVILSLSLLFSHLPVGILAQEAPVLSESQEETDPIPEDLEETQTGEEENSEASQNTEESISEMTSEPAEDPTEEPVPTMTSEPAEDPTEESVPETTLETEEETTEETAPLSAITRWSWWDPESFLTEGDLVLPGVSAENPIDLETIIAMLPAEILAGEERIVLSGWECPEFEQTETGWPVTGTYLFSAGLPEGYVLDEGADPLTVSLILPEENEVSLLLPGDVPISETTFPDPVFREYVKTKIDMDGNDILSQEEMETVYEISVSKSGITSLTGLEYFSNLNTLDCSGNNIQTIDLSKCTKLESLTIYGNALTELDLSHNPELYYCGCGGNQLASLDLTHNLRLNHLVCTQNPFTTLDLSANTELQVLECLLSQLTSLNLSQNQKLRTVYCGGPDLSDLQIGNKQGLLHLWIMQSQITSLDLREYPKLQGLEIAVSPIETLDLTQTPDMDSLRIVQTPITSLDISGLSKLKDLTLGGLSLSEVNLQNNKALKHLFIRQMPLTKLDLSGQTALERLSVEECNLTSLDLSRCASPIKLECTGNLYQVAKNETCLDLRDLPGFEVSQASGWKNARIENQYFLKPMNDADSVTYRYDTGKKNADGSILYADFSIRFSIDKIPIDGNHFPDPVFREYVKEFIDRDQDGALSNQERENVHEILAPDQGITSLQGMELFENMTRLECGDNQITELDVSPFSKLEYLQCANNPLVRLNLEGCKALLSIRAGGTSLEMIHLQNLPVLEEFYDEAGRLKSLKVENCPKLNTLDVSTNQLSSLEITGARNLQRLSCPYNQLKTLDIRNLPKLAYLNFAYNHVTEIKGSVGNLTHLYADENYLRVLDLGSCKKLRVLSCFNCQLTSLDISGCSELKSFECFGNRFLVKGRSISAADLPAGLDARKVSNVRGGSFDGNKFDISGKELTYTYDCGGGKTTDITLYFLETQSEGIPIDESHFPDPVFRQYILDYLDLIGDGILTPEEQAEVRKLELGNQDIHSLKGLAYFPNLEMLACWKNPLTELDVSHNPQLLFLNCFDMQLTALDVSNNPKLQGLLCGANQLRHLDLQKNPQLNHLSCRDNQLQDLNLQKNPALEMLDCSLNPLISLDVSRNPKLIQLGCQGCGLRDLNLSKCVGLQILECDGNWLTTLDLSKHTDLLRVICEDNQLKTLDVSSCTKLLMLYCARNQLETLNLGEIKDLEELNCRQNKLKNLDLSHCRKLKSLDCEHNALACINLQGMAEHAYFACAVNQFVYDSADGTLDLNTIPGFDRSKMRKAAGGSVDAQGILTPEKEGQPVTYEYDTGANEGNRFWQFSILIRDQQIYVDEVNFPDPEFRQFVLENLDLNQDGRLSNQECTRVQEIDLSGSYQEPKMVNSLQGISCFSQLRKLNVNHNQIRELDLTDLTNLETLLCERNPIRELDLSHCPGLKNLSVAGTDIQGLELSQVPMLEKLNCMGTALGELNVSGMSRLKMLDCSNCGLESLSLSGCGELNELKCGGNQLRELDLAECEKIEYLSCAMNQLAHLDVSRCKNLIGLFCQENKLVSLVMGEHPQLATLTCEANQLEELTVLKCQKQFYLRCNGNRIKELSLPPVTTLRLECDGNQIVGMDLSNVKTVAAFSGIGNTRTCETKKVPCKVLFEKFDKARVSDIQGGQLIGDAFVFTEQELTYRYRCGANDFLEVRLILQEENEEQISIDTVHFPDPGLRRFVRENLDLDQSGTLSETERASVTTVSLYNLGMKDLKGLEFFPNLEFLGIMNNGLTELDFSGDLRFRRLGIYEFSLESLNLESCSRLEELSVWDTNLRNPNLQGCTGLKRLNCPGNHNMGTLDLSSCTALETLNCEYSELKTLDLSHNPELKQLHCHNNRLTELDLSHQRKLETVSCGNNQLTSLDVSNLPESSSISAGDNQYAVGSTQVELSALPGSFRASRVLSVTGGSFAGGLFTFDENCREATYVYNMGGGNQETFKLILEEIPEENALILEDPALQDQYGVYVDGRFYPVTTSGGKSFVALPDGDCKSLVTYSYHGGDGSDLHTMYPTGMQVWVLRNVDGVYEARHVPELDDLLIYAGSSIRIVGKKGIRMITGIQNAKKNALTGDGLAGFRVLEYGTALAWRSDLDMGHELVLGESTTRSNHAYRRGVSDPVFRYAGDQLQYTNVLVGFSNDDCKKDLAMRSYIILEDEEGNQIPVYGGELYRSIGYIAYQNRRAFSVGSGAYDYVWEIIHHVYGDRYDEDYKK